jgi:hypothetical protein
VVKLPRYAPHARDADVIADALAAAARSVDFDGWRLMPRISFFYGDHDRDVLE